MLNSILVLVGAIALSKASPIEGAYYNVVAYQLNEPETYYTGYAPQSNDYGQQYGNNGLQPLNPLQNLQDGGAYSFGYSVAPVPYTVQVPSEVAQGQELKISFPDVNINERTLPTFLLINFDDFNIRIPIDTTNQTTNKDGSGKTEVVYTIPSDIPIGDKYRIHSEQFYVCNPAPCPADVRPVFTWSDYFKITPAQSYQQSTPSWGYDYQNGGNLVSYVQPSYNRSPHSGVNTNNNTVYGTNFNLIIPNTIYKNDELVLNFPDIDQTKYTFPSLYLINDELGLQIPIPNGNRSVNKNGSGYTEFRWFVNPSLANSSKYRIRAEQTAAYAPNGGTFVTWSNYFTIANKW